MCLATAGLLTSLALTLGSKRSLFGTQIIYEVAVFEALALCAQVLVVEQAPP